jgi:tRNA(adenine34) deaminase
MNDYNEEFMLLAIAEAQKAFKIDEVPMGCIIVKDNTIIGKGYNTKEKDSLVTSHAEIKAIEQASKSINNWRLIDCDVYVTLDPCPMCASALKQSRVRNIFSAMNNLDENNLKIIEEIFKEDKNNKSINFESNLFVDKANELLKLFFEKQRNK